MIARSRLDGSALHAHAGSVRAADVRARIAGFLVRADEAGRALVVVLGSACAHETMGRAEIAAGRLPAGGSS